MAELKRHTFPQSHRLKTPADFKHVYNRKRSARDELLLIYACENQLSHSRIGLSVSRKVGGAVLRNLYKRLYREAYRLTQHDLPPGLDMVLIPQRTETLPSLESLMASLVKLARNAASRLGMPRHRPGTS